MAEYIEREALMDALRNHYEVNNATQNATMDEVCMIALSQPAADVVLVRHGKWLEVESTR